jgi:hypothetical protein
MVNTGVEGTEIEIFETSSPRDLQGEKSRIHCASHPQPASG